MAIAIAIQHLVVDTNDPQLVVAFWSAVLGRPIADDWGDFVRLSPDESGTRLAFAAVPEAKSSKNRAHLDLAVTDREQAVIELIGLGGSLIETRSQGEQRTDDFWSDDPFDRPGRRGDDQLLARESFVELCSRDARDGLTVFCCWLPEDVEIEPVDEGHEVSHELTMTLGLHVAQVRG